MSSHDIPLYNISSLGEVEVDNAVIQDLAPGFYFQTHMHRTVEFFICLSGTITMVVRNRKIEVHAGEYFLCFPNFPHSAVGNGTEGCRILQIHFHVQGDCNISKSGSLMQASLFHFEILLGERQYVKNTCPAQLKSCIQGIYEEYHNRTSFSSHMISAYLYQMNILISRELESLQRDHFSTCSPHLLLASLYIKEHYSEHLTVPQVAQACNISDRYLSKLFHDQLGISVCSYIAHVRINQSIEIMRAHPDYPLIKLALDLGFSSQQHFSSVFKEIMSVSPKKYLTFHQGNL